ncbi:MAG: hypothetical protein ABI620_00130 [Chloroflexota bacterium]
MRMRWVRALLVAVVVIAAGWLTWRWAIQRVNVVIVNASGVPGSFSWQPNLFADEVSVSLGGCESKSIHLLAGERWHLVHESLEMNSAAIDMPLFTPAIAIEIWIDANGSSRFVPPYPIDGPVDLPIARDCPG